MSSYERRCWRRKSESCHSWSKRTDAVRTLEKEIIRIYIACVGDERYSSQFDARGSSECRAAP